MKPGGRSPVSINKELPTVFILDDHPAICEGLKTILDTSGRYKVVGLASSSAEARSALIVLHETGNTPSILLADNNLKGQSGIDFIREIVPLYPKMACIVISVSIRFDTITEALSGGARGYIGKDQDEPSMLRVLDAVTRGELGLEGEVLGVLADNAVRLSITRMGLERSRYDALTPREQEIFRLTALNTGVKEIAKELRLSTKTVENVKSSIFGKLGLRDRFELYKYAVRIGIIED
jgi:DNA-binding NarL/FixJ family response regulator